MGRVDPSCDARPRSAMSGVQMRAAAAAILPSRVRAGRRMLGGGGVRVVQDDWPLTLCLFPPNLGSPLTPESTAPPPVSLPGVRSVRGRITGFQHGAGTNPNLRAIRDAVVW